SKGVTSRGGKARITTLEQGLRVGLQELRAHSNEYRTLMRIDANYDRVACFIDKDLNEWAGQLFNEATDFVARHDFPPPFEDFPDVVTPSWTRLSTYIGAGGVSNSNAVPPSGARRGGDDGRRQNTAPGRGGRHQD
ncbi:unnamed protein product, partial [Ectocarpus fasciculatus]